MSTLGKAVVLFGADTALFRSDIGRAAAIFEQGVGRMSRSALGFKTAIGGSFTVGAFVTLGKQALDNADALGKLSQKTGIQVSALSGLQYAAQLANVEQETFNKAQIEFAKSLVQATNASTREGRVLRALGVDIKAGPLEAFMQFADGISRVGSEQLKTSAATAILKKAGADMVPALVGGRRGLEEAAAEAERLGLVIDEDFSKRANEFNDHLTRMQRSLTGLANTGLRGGLLDFLEDIAARFDQASQRGNVLEGVLDNLSTLGSNVVTRLGAALYPNNPAFSGVDQQFDEKQIKAMLEGRVAAGKIKARPGGDALGAGYGIKGFKPSDAELAKALADNPDALLKRQIAALQQMEEKKRSLFNLNEQDILQQRITTGTYKDFDQATKERLKGMAREIDLRKQTIDRIDAGIPALQAEAEAREQAGEVLRDFVETGREDVRGIEFQTSLLGQNARAQEKLTALRQIDVELLRRRAELARSFGDDMEGFDRAAAQLERSAEAQRQAVVAAIDARQKAERNWLTGAKAGLLDYADAAGNAAEQARNFFTDAFQGMEDALVDFIKTGKFNFHDLADSIIEDLIRIQVQQQITGPLAQALGLSGGLGSLGALFGASSGGSAAASAGAADVMGSSTVALAANGGIMTGRGMLPLSRYASGGIASSPQMAIFGEGSMPEAYVPLPDGRRIPVNIRGASSGGGTYYIDARGADQAAIARLEASIRALNGSIEHRAIAAVADAKARGGAFAKRMS